MWLRDPNTLDQLMKQRGLNATVLAQLVTRDDGTHPSPQVIRMLRAGKRRTARQDTASSIAAHVGVDTDVLFLPSRPRPAVDS